jgi:hypothetical protein
LRRLSAALVLALSLFTAGCGGRSAFSAQKTEACLRIAGARFGGKLDFVATTATGGAFVARLRDNWVTIAFGLRATDAEALGLAYERFAFPNVRRHIGDVLVRYDNAVLLWHSRPSAADLALVTGCLQ